MIKLAYLCAAGAIAGGVLVSAQQSPQQSPPPPQPGPGQGSTYMPQPRRQFGTSITGAFEGWYYNPDGSRSFLIGYFNRNTQQELDVPIGPNNNIEPGGPDMGQPTHFLPGRQWGMFTVAAPKEFKDTDSYVWTLTANGITNRIPLRLKSDYVMSPFEEIAVHNTPPVLRWEQGGPSVQGPISTLVKAPSRNASLDMPFALTAWAADDMKYTNGTSAPLTANRQPVTMRFSKYRGPGKVTFDKVSPAVEKLPAGEGGAPFNGKATTNVKFSEA
ncbi:MAG TPA: hypothetical protein VNZ26_21175, partial [Vicinamibacterales bacterium]|nr:hypothetical protein [Vicinamibacterales bacterium]